MKISCLLVAACLGLFINGAVAEVDPAVQKSIQIGLNKGREDIRIAKVSATPIDGLYYVKLAGGPVLYASADGGYFLQGDLIEVQKGNFTNWTDNAFVDERRKLVAAIDVETTIRYPATTDPQAFMYVFTDVDCGYCRKLHAEIPELNARGIEVRYLAYPRAGAGSGAYRKMVSAWCAKDPGAAMTKLKEGQAIPELSCTTHPIDAHMLLVQELDLSGTPAVIFADGTIVPGYRTAAEFAEILGVR